MGRWDSVNARQRKRCKNGQVVAHPSLLTSPAIRRPPPKCGAFRRQPRGSLLRRTPRWRKPDSNHWSRLRRPSFQRRLMSLLVDSTARKSQRERDPTPTRMPGASRGTDGSNPVSSSRESGTNRFPPAANYLARWRRLPQWKLGEYSRRPKNPRFSNRRGDDGRDRKARLAAHAAAQLRHPSARVVSTIASPARAGQEGPAGAGWLETRGTIGGSLALSDPAAEWARERLSGSKKGIKPEPYGPIPYAPEQRIFCALAGNLNRRSGKFPP